MKTSELELIMAYHDGELPLGRRIEVELWLDTRPEARAYLDELQAADRHYRQGMAALLEKGASRPLTDGLNKNATGKLIRFPVHWPSVRQAWALAASLVLMLALGGGWWIQSQPGSDTTHFAQALNSALETTPSGELYQGAGDDVQIMPLASYYTDREQHCREYAGRYAAQQVFGLACRNGAGRWVPVLEEGKELRSAGGADIYVPASGGKDHVEEQLEAMGAGKALTPEREAQLLAEQWR